MVSNVMTFAFEGVEARRVDVQVQFAGGQPAFIIVGLPDKAVSEARERVRAALSAIGLGLPPKRIIVNLAPADLPKDGGHFDLPIALALLMELGATPRDAADRFAVIGELGLDATLAPVAGALPARGCTAPACISSSRSSTPARSSPRRRWPCRTTQRQRAS
ncbi:MAG: magnesium chelatase domain-containing protein, partial [Pseudomonadota bacterium]